MLVGTSRKAFIGVASLGGATCADARDDGTLATVVWAIDHGAARRARARRPRRPPTRVRLLTVMRDARRRGVA